MSNQEGKKEIGPSDLDPFSEAAIKFRAGEDAVFQSILDAPHLRDVESAKRNWPKIRVNENLDLSNLTNFVNPFSEAGKALIESGEAIFDLTLGAYVKKSYLDELYGKPKKTPVENRKLRNACISGHTPEQYAKCPFCRQARFYQITSGYHGDMPELGEVEKVLRQTEQTDDRKFVLEYLELPENATRDQIDAFLIKMVWFEKLTTWAKRTYSSQHVLHPFSRNYVPLAPPFQGKSGFVASLIRDHQVIREIYQSAIMVGADEFAGSFDTERFLKQFDRPDAKGKTAVARGLLPPDQKTITAQPRRGNALNKAIGEVLRKNFVGVDPGSNPPGVVVVDSLGGFNRGDMVTHASRDGASVRGYSGNKFSMAEPAKKPPSKLMQAMMQRFNKQ